MSEPIRPQRPVARRLQAWRRLAESSPLGDPDAGPSEQVSGEDLEDPIEDFSEDENPLDPPDPSLSLVPGTLPLAEAAISAQPQPEGIRAYVTRLCSCSEGQATYEDVSKGMEILATDVQGLPIEAGQPEDGPGYRTHVSAVYVWLLAVLNSSFDGVAQRMPIATELGSLFLCAHATLPERFGGPWHDFMSAIMCCEEGLGKKKAFVEWVLDPGDTGPLASLILNKERESQTSTGRQSALKSELDDEELEVRLTAELLYILASMDEDLLKAVIQGRVFEQGAIHDHPVRKALQRLEPMKSQPSIYINGIADSIGISPAPYHWAEVCGYMKLYLEISPDANRLAEAVDQVVSKVDTWSGARAKKGLRRYTDFLSSHVPTFPSVNQRRRQTVRYFISQIESRITTET